MGQRCSAYFEACCVERVIAPMIVVTLHLLLVADVACHREHLLQLQDARAYFLWLLVLATLACYLQTSLTGPGWVGQSQPPFRCYALSAVAIPGLACRACSSEDEKGRREEAQVDLESVVIGQSAAEGEDDTVPLTAPASEDATGIKRRGGEDEDAAKTSGVPMQSGIEQLWCKRCRVYQPLRSKHCRDCERCVLTHDHHCPWIGTCVGENNRMWFLGFLILQEVELVLFFAEGLRGISVLRPSVLLLFGLLFIAMFALMVLCLLSFHLFLLISNMTTWEQMSWKRITYLKSRQESDGSPFSRTIVSNVLMYCFGPSWCPTRLKRHAGLKYDENGSILWEVLDASPPCLVRCCLQSGC